MDHEGEAVATDGEEERSMTVQAAVPDRKITRDDIESKLRELQGEVTERAEATRVPAIAVAVGVVFVAIAAAYVFGRRKGRRRQTIFEIRRI
jgi:hypothetical protein